MCVQDARSGLGRPFDDIGSRSSRKNPLLEDCGCYGDISEVTTTNVLATLNSRLNPFRPIAACWAKAEPLSLTDWVSGEFFLLLPQDETARAPLVLLNGLIFDFLVQQLLGYQTNEQLKAQTSA